jgi:Flp pilus assembly protein TadD
VLGGVLALRGDREGARAELSRALELYERKGNLVGADRVRAQLAPSTQV